MATNKNEEITHPPLEQLEGLDYCINSNPPWPETMILAFQHYLLMLGTTVMVPTFLVPTMGGDDHDKVRVIQTLFVAGLNTLLQSLFGTRLPTVSSYYVCHSRSFYCFVKHTDHPWLQPTLGHLLLIFQSSWYATSDCFGWNWLVQKRLSCGI